MITIVVIGKKHQPWVAAGIERHQERLRGPWKLSWVVLPSSNLQSIRARQNESEAILKRLKPGKFVVLLDERGEMLDSPALSRKIESAIDHSQAVTVIIGGAYGVDDSLRTRADLVWSLSALVFPHQLVRLIVAEQLYRAQEISAGRPYHHD